MLATYGKSEDFSTLCDSLGRRLEDNGNVPAATLCYICAVNVERVIAIWVNEIEQAASTMAASSGGVDMLSQLQSFIEKAQVFVHARQLT